MAASSSRDGFFYGGAVPYRSREGLTTRPVGSSDEIQLRIDPMHADFDDEISGLRGQVKLLRNVAQEIGSEAKFQKDFLDQLSFALCSVSYSQVAQSVT
ncbi:bet1-like protein At4g14600 isoform X2 [Ricinus communis]|uniref:bet1-like protein At4g14600 isoform X2 n=1 Tax=Ricinus communis TaxID=3988 RepID=UPI00201A7704|nr:bet1-like protein At4g14600 isoform X2 [Ricinus communis]